MTTLDDMKIVLSEWEIADALGRVYGERLKAPGCLDEVFTATVRLGYKDGEYLAELSRAPEGEAKGLPRKQAKR